MACSGMDLVRVRNRPRVLRPYVASKEGNGIGEDGTNDVQQQDKQAGSGGEGRGGEDGKRGLVVIKVRG